VAKDTEGGKKSGRNGTNKVPAQFSDNELDSDDETATLSKSEKSKNLKKRKTRTVNHRADSEDEKYKSDCSIRSSERRNKGKGGRVDQLTKLDDLIDPVTRRSQASLIDEQLFDELENEDYIGKVSYCSANSDILLILLMTFYSRQSISKENRSHQILTRAMQHLFHLRRWYACIFQGYRIH
jgi:hypothetical protein